MTDDQIETWLFDLIDTHKSKENRSLVKRWLEKRIAAYDTMIDLNIINVDKGA